MELLGLVERVEHLVARDGDGGRAFYAAFDFDVAGLRLLAVRGRRIGGHIPAAFLRGDIHDAAAARFFDVADGIQRQFLDPGAGGGIGGEGRCPGVIGRLVPEHFSEIAGRRIAHVDKTLAAVHERLTKEIDFWSDRYLKLTDDKAAGKDVRLNLENARRTLADLESRLESRKRELQSMRHVTSATPVVLSGALVVPAGLLRKLRGDEPPDNATPTAFSTDPAARARIEKLALDAVRRAEESRGCRVVDVSAQKCGWDLTSYPPPTPLSTLGRGAGGEMSPQPEARHIEVKGRVKGATTVTITRNEMLYALNQSDKFHLAIVIVGENDAVDGPHYLTNPFDSEPGWGVSSINYNLADLLQRATQP